MNDDQISLFNEDENRAMLGVVTEGNEKGAVIQSVTKESAAEKAGIKEGDIITKVNGATIDGHSDLVATIGKMNELLMIAV